MSWTRLQPAETLLSLQASMRRISEGTILSTRMDIHTAMALSPSVPSKGPLGSKMKFKASQSSSKQVPQKQFSLGPIVSTCLYCLRWELETRARTCESFKESDRLSLHCGLQRHSPYSPCKSISPYQLSLAVHLWLPLYKHSLGHPQTPVQSLNAKPINVLKYIEMNWPAPRISVSEVSKQFANRPFAQSLVRSQYQTKWWWGQRFSLHSKQCKVLAILSKWHKCLQLHLWTPGLHIALRNSQNIFGPQTSEYDRFNSWKPQGISSSTNACCTGLFSADGVVKLCNWGAQS